MTMSRQCPDCGWEMQGDGYTSPIHCETLNVLGTGREPDAPPLTCGLGRPWYSHPEFPVEDWQAEVAQGDTRLGYEDWTEQQLGQQQPAQPDQPAHPYEAEVRSLCTRLVQAGARLRELYLYEDDEHVVVNSIEQVVDDILSVDACNLRIFTPEHKSAGLMLILGNDPGELVADYSCCLFLDRMTQEHAEEWEKH